MNRREFVATSLLAHPVRSSISTEGMVLIAGGTFLMGTEGAAIDKRYGHVNARVREMLAAEVPQHRVTLDPYYMDECEVTNGQFYRFIEQNSRWQRDRIDSRFHNGDYLKDWSGDQYPPGKAEYPVVYVSWYAAMAFAQWAGKRLPTESEWEFAARGGLTDAEYPWGNAPPSPERANYGDSHLGGPTAVGRYAANGYGLHDMAGNVWEYCLDEWAPNYDGARERQDDASIRRTVALVSTVRTRRVIRGGSWGGSPVNLRVSFRDSHPPEGAGPHVGFRCASSAAR